MPKHNVENEIAKRDYLSWLKNARGRDAATLDQAAAAIDAYQAHTRQASFKTFRREKAVAFKEHLRDQTNAATGKPLSQSTVHSRLNALKAFFEWLAREPGYRKALNFHDAAYFGLSANDVRIATAKREQQTPSLEQIISVLETMPSETVVERRDRALVAFLIISGARDSAVASLRMKHVNLATGRIFQDARTVKTKRAKTFTSVFYPMGELPTSLVSNWIDELQTAHRFGPDDPIFPATQRGLDEHGMFKADALSRAPWTSAAPIRAVVKAAFTRAGLPYYAPHSFRRTVMNVGYSLNLSLSELKAWSQNLGHDSPVTSLASYGTISLDDQAALIAQAGARRENADADEDLTREIAALVRKVRSKAA